MKEIDIKITIITPTFNAEKDIESCILSVANQDYQNMEHLIIDGKSTDNTLAIVKKYASEYNHIKFISEKDSGIYDAMNKGIEIANGKWLYFLGSDDTLYNENVLRNVLDRQNIEELDVIYGNVKWGNTDKVYDGKFSRLKLMNENICHQSIFFKKSLFEKNGKFNLKYQSLADYEFNIKWFNDDSIRVEYVDTLIANFSINGCSANFIDKSFFEDRGRIISENFPKEYGELNEKLSILNFVIEQNNKELKVLKEEIAKRDSKLDDILNSYRWKIANGIYKIYLKKIKIFIPRIVFRFKDIFLLLLRKLIFNFKKINIKQIRNRVFRQAPFITIGIASYNHSKYLEKCINSALNQTYKKFEIVIVDDNSNDPLSKKILSKYENNPRIRILYKDKNEGISASLNDQVINAKGDWVAFMDCDDYLPENALFEMAKYIKSNPEKELVFSNRIEIDQNDKFLRKVWFGNRYKEGKMFEELLKGMVSSHLKLISKKAFQKVGLFDPRFGGTHDYDIFLRVAFYMPMSFGFVDKYLYYHRIHENQNTTVESDKHKKNVETILKESRLRQTLYNGQFEKKVSIIVLSYNRYDKLKNTIEKIVKYSKNIKKEIIVWDNGSNYSKLLEYLKKIDGKNAIKVVFCKENLKAAEGRKRATKMSNGDYILYFDNDIEVQKGFLEEMILRLEESDEIASCCSKVVFPDGKIQFTGGLIRKKDEKFISFVLDNNGKNEKDLNSMIKRDYDWLGSGATMTKKRFSNIIEFDPGFINAYEDNDYYMQIKDMGGRLVHVPTSTVIHHHVSYEMNHDAGTKDYVKIRHNKELFIKSWQYFFKKRGLIVLDDFILGLVDLKDASLNEIELFIKNKI